MAEAKCPVDHASAPAPTHLPQAEQCPVDHRAMAASSSSGDKCPVDPSTRSSWRSFLPFLSQDSAASPHPPDSGTSAPTGAHPSLSTDREVSSIPRGSGTENWVYPSEAQFFAAMARKKHNPQATDMQVVVPIHNAVNERAWTEILKWEDGRGAEKCGGVKLVSFKGRPGDMTPRARWRSLLGYTPPFDRHDWVVDRCGVRTRYVIDFYSGRSLGPAAGMPSFFLDVRPALDNFDGVKMRAERLLDRWFGGITRTQPTADSARTPPPGTGTGSST